MPTNPKLAAALWYAKRGWPVFAAHTPTRSGCSCAKKHRCPDIGKHPRWDRKLLSHGVHSATTDAAQIRRWWRKWPDANIGVATGTASGLIVLDVDPRNGGLESLETLQVTHERLSDTVQAITGGGGNHFVLEHPGPPTHIRNSSGELATGLDIKGDGGYIIAPPSLHVSGKPYEWKAGHSPKDLAPAKPPPWLLALVTKPAPRQEPPAPDQPIPEGQRNSTLFKNGCAMRRRGLGYDAILAALRVENAKRCKPPLDDKDVEKIADRAAKYQPADPNTRDVQDKDATLDEALTKAQEILVALQQTPDVRLVYQALGILCALPAEEWGPFKSEYKAILGNRLNLRDLDRAFKEAKYRQSQVRQTARESTDASDARKRVQINDRQLPDITADALSTVTTLYHQTPTHPQIYVRSGTLQRLVTDEDGRPILELLRSAPAGYPGTGCGVVQRTSLTHWRGDRRR